MFNEEPSPRDFALRVFERRSKFDIPRSAFDIQFKLILNIQHRITNDDRKLIQSV